MTFLFQGKYFILNKVVIYSAFYCTCENFEHHGKACHWSMPTQVFGVLSFGKQKYMPVVNQSGRSDLFFIMLLYITVSMGWTAINFLIQKLWSLSNPGISNLKFALWLELFLQVWNHSIHSPLNDWLSVFLPQSSLLLVCALSHFLKFVSRNYLFQLMMEDLLFQFAVLSYLISVKLFHIIIEQIVLITLSASFVKCS